jgi:hypothetical protein
MKVTGSVHEMIGEAEEKLRGFEIELSCPHELAIVPI